MTKCYYSEDERMCFNQRLHWHLFDNDSSLDRKEDKCKILNRVINRKIRWRNKKHQKTGHKLIEEIQAIKSFQCLTNRKLDSLIEMVVEQKQTRSRCSNYYNITNTVSNFRLEIIARNLLNATPSKLKSNDDYFSFKIKPDMTLSSVSNELKEMKTVERETLSTPYKKFKSSQSPDHLITLKFFEDTENYRNGNFLSVKSLNNNFASTNPFVSSFKSEGEIHKGMIPINANSITIEEESKYRLTSMLEEVSKKEEEREDKEDVTPRVCENTTDNNIGSDLKEDFSESEKKKTSLRYEMENENTSGGKNREKCGSKNGNVLLLRQINSTLNTIGDNNNESASVMSGNINININASQERLNKVRGFNFKNNINTKKFARPLRTNSTHINSSNATHANPVRVCNSISEYCNDQIGKANEGVSNVGGCEIKLTDETKMRKFNLIGKKLTLTKVEDVSASIQNEK